MDIEDERLDVGVGEDSAIGWHADVSGVVAFGDLCGRIENGFPKIFGGGLDGLAGDEFSF